MGVFFFKEGAPQQVKKGRLAGTALTQMTDHQAF
jgi:hypothetical protein